MVSTAAFPTDAEKQMGLRSRLAAAVTDFNDLGVSTNGLAVEVGVDQSTLRRQLSGTRSVDEHLLYRLERELDDLKAERAAKGALPAEYDLPRAGVPLRLMGQAQAGTRDAAEEQDLGEVRVDPSQVPRGRAYVLRVEGGAMWPTLATGDLVVVDADAQPRSGEIVVVTIPGEGTVLRRLRVRRGKGLLEAEADAFGLPIPRDDEDVLLHGVVHAIVGRSLR